MLQKSHRKLLWRRDREWSLTIHTIVRSLIYSDLSLEGYSSRTKQRRNTKLGIQSAKDLQYRSKVPPLLIFLCTMLGCLIIPVIQVFITYSICNIFSRVSRGLLQESRKTFSAAQNSHVHHSIVRPFPVLASLLYSVLMGSHKETYNMYIVSFWP